MLIFSVIILILSASFHEYMHGWAADQLGDRTARDAGRLTVNPLAHLDMVGSVFLPLLLLLAGSPFVFGYAKPVPFNPNNLRDPKWGGALVAVAGPFANFMLALGFGLLLRVAPLDNAVLLAFISSIVIINLLLMVFNLLPIPPLDGSKIIMPLLPYHWQRRLADFEPWGMVLVFAFILVGMGLIWRVVLLLLELIVGTDVLMRVFSGGIF